MLYHKVGANVEFSTNFPGFYNMNISDKEPYITLIRSGGKQLDSKKRRSSKKRSRRSRSKKRNNKRKTNKRRFKY